MKKIIIGLLALTSMSTFAQDLTMACHPKLPPPARPGTRNDLGTGWVDPTSKLPFSLESDADGVCILMGCKKAVPGSVSKATYEKTKLTFGGRWFSDGGFGPKGRPIEGGPYGDGVKTVSRPVKTDSVIVDEFGRITTQVSGKIIGGIQCVD